MSSAEFKDVYTRTRELKTASNEEALKLYALAKVAQGEDINASPAPGMFDLRGKAKRKAWQEMVDSGKTAEEAEAEYVVFGKELLEKYSA